MLSQDSNLDVDQKFFLNFFFQIFVIVNFVLSFKFHMHIFCSKKLEGKHVTFGPLHTSLVTIEISAFPHLHTAILKIRCNIETFAKIN